MKLLTLSYCMPPALFPQSIQIGRLLAYLPPRYQLYLISADDASAVHDAMLYPDLRGRFSGHIQRRYSGHWGWRLLRKLWSVVLPIPDSFLWWHLAVEREVVRRWQGQPFDGVLTFACPMSSCILGWRLKRRFNAPWIAFLSDPWTNNPYFRQIGPARWINAWMEAKTFADADVLVMPSEEMRLAYAKKYPQHASKLRVLPHSYDRQLYPPRAARSAGPLVLRYIGNFYGQRSAQTLLQALAGMLARGALRPDEIRLEIIGGMPQRYLARYRRTLAALGLQDIVQFLPGVPYLRSLELMCSADVLVLIDADIPGSPFFPSKLADYLGAARPILAITPADGASARILQGAGGWLAPPRRSRGYCRGAGRGVGGGAQRPVGAA